MRKAYAVYVAGNQQGDDAIYQRTFASRADAMEHLQKELRNPSVVHGWVQEVVVTRQSIDGKNLELFK